MAKSVNTVRKGSIPLVMIIVVCLGIFAVSSIFMSGSTARLDKKAEVTNLAVTIAQAAIDETLVKMQNGNAETTEAEKKAYNTPATELAFGYQKGIKVKIAPVQVLTRQVEAPKDDAEALRAFILLTTGPSFYRATGKTPRPATTFTTDQAYETQVLGRDDEPAKGSATDSEGLDGWRKALRNRANATNHPTPEAKAEAQMWWEVANTGISYGTMPKTIEELKDKTAGPIGNGGATANFLKAKEINVSDQAADQSQGACKPLKVDAAFDQVLPLTTPSEDGATTPNAGLAAFQTQWDAAMLALGQQTIARVQGCAGDPVYGIAAYTAALNRGKGVAADGKGEQDREDSCRASGMLDFEANLATLEATVTVEKAGISSTQPYTSQRMIQKVKFTEAHKFLVNQTMAYLHFYYGLSKADFLAMQYDGKPLVAASPTGKLAANNTLLTKFNDMFSTDGTRVFPFGIANCRAKMK